MNPFDRLSWQWKLPLLIASVCLIAITSFAIVSYREVRETAFETTYAKFRSVLSELSAIAALGAVNQLETLRTSATDAAIVATAAAASRESDASRNSLHHGGPEAAPSASAETVNALEQLRIRSGAAAAIIAVELHDAHGRLIHQLTPSRLPGRSMSGPPDSVPGIGPILQHDTVTYFWSTAPVVRARRVVGAVRVARRLGSGGVSRRLVTSRMGENAQLMLGNGDSVAWMGQERVAVPRSDTGLLRYARDGIRRVGASKPPMSNVSWQYTVELPESDVLAPARRLILPMITAGVLIAVASALLGLLLSRGITAPLIELTAAAEAIARGDRTVHLVERHRADEIGRLARAFGTMADSVNAVLSRLESEVDARAGELGTAMDRLRVLHDELRQHERLAALGRTYGSVGHELRNPLGVMSNVVFLLDTVPDASPKLAQYAALLREQIRLSQRIISDLLDSARDSARAGVPAESPTDVREMVERLLNRAAIPASVRVEVLAQADLPRVVLDADRVGQIIWNLLSNAVQAMPDGGTLTITADIRDGRLSLAIRDSGPGVAAEERERIFQPLYTTKTDGVGLGLSISREFARANGGDLYVEGDGPGARFVLELPVTPV